MIIIKEARGYKYSTLKSAMTLGVCTCPACKKVHRMYVETICKVEHVLYVPIYAHQKRVIVRCPACETTFTTAYFSSISRDLIDSVSKVSYRWYHFFLSGFTTLLVLIYVVGMLYSHVENKDTMRHQIATVSKGSVIFYELENGDRTTMYVTDSVGDTLYVRQNKKSVMKGDVYLIDEPENYTEKVTLFSRKKLEEMFEENKVYRIYETTTTLQFNSELFENI